MSTNSINDHIRITFRAQNNLLISEREKRGFSQKQMAKYLGVNIDQYGNAERLKQVSVKVIEKIATGLDMTIETLFPEWALKYGTMINYGQKYLILSDEFVEATLEPASNEGLVHLLQDSLHEDINTVLSQLSSEKRQIVEMYFGLNGYDPHTLQEIGDAIGMTRAGVNYHLQRILKKLREKKKATILKPYLG